MGSFGQNTHDPSGQKNIGSLAVKRFRDVTVTKIFLFTGNYMRIAVHAVQCTCRKVGNLTMNSVGTVQICILAGNDLIGSSFIFDPYCFHPLGILLSEDLVQCIQFLHSGIEFRQLIFVQSSIRLHPSSRTAIVVLIRHNDGVHTVDHPEFRGNSCPRLLGSVYQRIQIVDLGNIFFLTINGRESEGGWDGADLATIDIAVGDVSE